MRENMMNPNCLSSRTTAQLFLHGAILVCAAWLLRFQALTLSGFCHSAHFNRKDVCYVDTFIISLHLRMSTRSLHATVPGRNCMCHPGDERFHGELTWEKCIQQGLEMKTCFLPALLLPLHVLPSYSLAAGYRSWVWIRNIKRD